MTPEGWNMSIEEWVKSWTIPELEAFAKYLSFRTLTDDQKQQVVNEVMKEWGTRQLTFVNEVEKELAERLNQK